MYEVYGGAEGAAPFFPCGCLPPTPHPPHQAVCVSSDKRSREGEGFSAMAEQPPCWDEGRALGIGVHAFSMAQVRGPSSHKAMASRYTSEERWKNLLEPRAVCSPLFHFRDHQPTG